MLFLMCEVQRAHTAALLDLGSDRDDAEMVGADATQNSGSTNVTETA
jgi:hypothetical protein